MRRTVVAVGALAILAAVMWGSQRSPRSNEEARAAVMRAEVPKQAASGAAIAEPNQAGKRGWVQSEADKAWCRLPDPLPSPEMKGIEQITTEELQRILDTSPSHQQYLRERARLVADWVQALRARDDERSQAAADMLDDSDTARKHLMDLARSTGDPMVYGWAMQACSKMGNCELSARRWVQLDPGNLAPWMWESEAALRSGNAQAQREALYQIGVSTRNENYVRPLQNMLSSLTDAQVPGLQMAVETEVLASVFASATAPMRGMGDYCVKAGIEADPSRHDICLAAAESLWRQADNTLDAKIASLLAQRHVAMNDPHWMGRRNEVDDLQELGSKWFGHEFAAEKKLNVPCAGVALQRGQVLKMVAMGELAALRQLRDTSLP